MVIENDNISFEKNTHEGQLIINNKSSITFSLDVDLQKLLNLSSNIISKSRIIHKLNIPTSYFLPCDFIDRTENLLNGKPSNLLAKFLIRGQPHEKIDYIPPAQKVFCDAAQGDKYLHSLTISVKDENGNLFDCRGFPLEFVLEIIWLPRRKCLIKYITKRSSTLD